MQEKEILNLIKKTIINKEFDKAISLVNNSNTTKIERNLKFRLLASIYFKKKDWENAIKYYEKVLPNSKDKFGIYNNIGISYFNLGELKKSVVFYLKSIENNQNFDVAHENLAITYKNLDDYESAIKSFVMAFEINKNNKNARNQILYLLNYVKIKNKTINPIIECDFKINELLKNLNFESINSEKFLKNLFFKIEEIIDTYKSDFFLDETQIYRRNKENLNCSRHFKVFNRFKIIPKYCFNCYKIQIDLKNIVDLVKLNFLFNILKLEKNNIRKCIVEIRPNVPVNYKGYIYCESLDESQEILKNISNDLKKINFDKIKIITKHGCSEFYEVYPKFKDINYDGKQQMSYDVSWQKKEEIIDKEINNLNSNEFLKKNTLKSINLYDVLIMKNWFAYAKIIEDKSLDKIYNGKLNLENLNPYLKDQLNFRKSN